MNLHQRKKYVLVIPDGGGDVYRENGLSPLAMAETPHADFLAREGVTGLVQTLYSDLPKESIVAQLGMLGWNPYFYYPNGRASCELLALEGIHLGANDLAFRANLVRMNGSTLVSYNADYILSERALPIVHKLNNASQEKFPDFELYHNLDFRNTLVVRDTNLNPKDLHCPEPHENHGQSFDLKNLISGCEPRSKAVAERINYYLRHTAQILRYEPANMLFPWSPSKALCLPSFKDNTGFGGKTAIVGCMDFLHGIAKAGGLEFFKVGNGRPDTDYEGKGRKVVELLAGGYEFVLCHINAPDEASHMGNLEMKIKSLEQIDRYVLGPVVEYFQNHLEDLGGIMLVPDHYTNHAAVTSKIRRVEIHSSHHVPFALWNGVERDATRSYCEDSVLEGKYSKEPINHLQLLNLLGVKQLAAHIQPSGR